MGDPVAGVRQALPVRPERRRQLRPSPRGRARSLRNKHSPETTPEDSAVGLSQRAETTGFDQFPLSPPEPAARVSLHQTVSAGSLQRTLEGPGEGIADSERGQATPRRRRSADVTGDRVVVIAVSLWHPCLQILPHMMPQSITNPFARDRLCFSIRVMCKHHARRCWPLPALRLPTPAVHRHSSDSLATAPR